MLLAPFYFLSDTFIRILGDALGLNKYKLQFHQKQNFNHQLYFDYYLLTTNYMTNYVHTTHYISTIKSKATGRQEEEEWVTLFQHALHTGLE